MAASIAELSPASQLLNTPESNILCVLPSPSWADVAELRKAIASQCGGWTTMTSLGHQTSLRIVLMNPRSAAWRIAEIAQVLNQS
jgi:hypothetical protein